MKVTRTVCDQCEGEPATAYELRSNGRLKRIDLCADHSEPVERLLGDAKPRGRAAATAKRTATKKVATKRPSKRVTSMAEIEKLKK